MGKEALVVDRDILFKEKYFQGFLPSHEHDFIQLVLETYKYYPRGDELENNSALQQIIPYVWIVNPETKKVFAYRRADNKNYSEKRLRNKWSCGLGGHVERQDSGNPIETAMMRELMEEVLMPEYPKPKIVGYLNDDSDDVGKVHFGVVALAETNHDIKIGDNEIAECKMCSIQELDKMFENSENDFEKWTRFSWPFIKNYLLSK